MILNIPVLLQINDRTEAWKHKSKTIFISVDDISSVEHSYLAMKYKCLITNRIGNAAQIQNDKYSILNHE